MPEPISSKNRIKKKAKIMKSIRVQYYVKVLLIKVRLNGYMTELRLKSRCSFVDTIFLCCLLVQSMNAPFHCGLIILSQSTRLLIRNHTTFVLSYFKLGIVKGRLKDRLLNEN